jgi:hypothetical protein
VSQESLGVEVTTVKKVVEASVIRPVKIDTKPPSIEVIYDVNDDVGDKVRRHLCHFKVCVAERTTSSLDLESFSGGRIFGRSTKKKFDSAQKDFGQNLLKKKSKLFLV